MTRPLTLCLCEIVLSKLMGIKQGEGGTMKRSLQSLQVGLLTAAQIPAQVSLCICLDLWPFVC